MVSSFMPDVQVEIAFNSGYVTPAASRTWTDVSAYVELADGIDINFGRQDENSTADANDLTLTLDNSDGRFTAFRAASPYYPNVKIGRPIRVKVTPPGGSTVTRFVGFIDEWPVEWDGTDAYAKASIRATSRMARLGLNAKLKSLVEQEILDVDGLEAYYTLGESSGATAASDSSGSGAAPLTTTGTGTAVVFGNATGPGTDGLTAAEFAGGEYLSTWITATPRALRATIKLNTLPSLTATDYIIAVIDSGGGRRGPYITTTGEVAIAGGLVGPNINDGQTHDVLMTLIPGTTNELYVDGVLAGTTAPTGSLSGFQETLEYRVGYNLKGVVSHAAVYTGGIATGLFTTAAADQWEAISDGFAGDTTDVRLLRLLDYAGVASTEVDVETGVETMTYQLTSGMSVMDALRECESTEGGVLFDGADGDVKFHNRSHRYLKTPAATLDMESQHVGSDYAPKLDRSTLVNDVTVENPTTGETARATDATSSDEYGIATGSATSVAWSYDPLAEKATWLINSYAEPRIRVPSLTVDVLAHQGLTPSAQTLLGLTVGDLLAVTNAPTQSDTTDPEYFVEGYTESIGPESYEITFNLSPAYPTTSTFILDSATRGLLDTNLLAY